MLRRKLKKETAASLKSRSMKTIQCSICNSDSSVDSECESVICSHCVAKRIPVDPKLLAPRQKPVETQVVVDVDGTEVVVSAVRPRGWHLMKEFIDADGTVYHTGVEVPELKGTIPVSDTIAIKKSQKEKSAERKALKEARRLKKVARREKMIAKEKKKQEKERKKKERNSKE